MIRAHLLNSTPERLVDNVIEGDQEFPDDCEDYFEFWQHHELNRFKYENLGWGMGPQSL